MNKGRPIPPFASKCSAAARDGRPCRARPVKGTDRCVLHTPARASAVHEAGGRARAAKVLSEVEAATIQLADQKAVPASVEFLAQAVLTGRVDAHIGSTVGYLASIAVRAADSADLAVRLEALEEALKARRNVA